MTTADLRYAFGANWLGFLQHLDEDRIAEARASLQKLLGHDRLDCKTFLDIGSGSGLFSLAARQLGARVHSFDYDANSVEATNSLRSRFFPNDPNWIVERGSILDGGYLAALGTFDIVYSWGVLHHTGAMYTAIKNASHCVSPGGILCVALYCKTPACWAWPTEKRIYVRSPRLIQAAIEKVYVGSMRAVFALRGGDFKAFVRDYDQTRGMEFMTNVRDWLGGYPYESISEAEMLALGEQLNLAPVRRFCVKPSHGLFGTHCDEYVFRAPT